MAHTNADDELRAYTLAHGDPSFIHQHVVDAFAAQRADERTKPITLTFALVGLYLHVERSWSGRQVQLAHVKLARQGQDWPTFLLPLDRGTMTASDVMRTAPGAERDRMIDAWCAAVWEAYRSYRDDIITLLRKHSI